VSIFIKLAWTIRNYRYVGDVSSTHTLLISKILGLSKIKEYVCKTFILDMQLI
jgi:hypothetical protein